jgi:hypothetical protein
MSPIEQLRLLQTISGFNEILDDKLEQAMSGYKADQEEMSRIPDGPIEGTWEELIRERQQQEDNNEQ